MVNNIEYNDKSIKVPDSLIEHIRESPSMYVSNTENPNHLIEEIFNNSVDEALSGYGNIIALFFNSQTNMISILDNGRGIPIENNSILTLFKTYSSSKFTSLKSKGVYINSAGLNGLGNKIVNALSSELIIEVYRDNKYAKYIFNDGKLISSDIIDHNNSSKPFSTKISFIPNKKYFDTIIPDMSKIRNRMTTLSAHLINVTFVLMIDNNKEIIKLSKDDFFKNECLMHNDKNISNIIDIPIKIKKEELDITFCYSLEGSLTPKITSSVNLLNVSDGGTHVNLLLDLFKELFTSYGKKYNKRFQPNDCLIGLRSYIALFIQNIEFSAQTKTKLVTKKIYLEKLFIKLKDELLKYFNKNEDDLLVLLDRFEYFRNSQDSKKLTNITGKIGKRGSSKFTKLKDCTELNGQLFIVEGDSAASSIIKYRNIKDTAILPLRGVIPNILTMKPSKLLENEEIKDLINALGCGIYENCDINKLRYSEIIIATDADYAGYFISALLGILFCKLTPDLVKNNKIFFAITPLYVYYDKHNNVIPLWNEEELEKARLNGEKIAYRKGLGEHRPIDLKTLLLDRNIRKLIPLEWSEQYHEKIFKLFSTSEDKKKLVMGEWKI